MSSSCHGWLWKHGTSGVHYEGPREATRYLGTVAHLEEMSRRLLPVPCCQFFLAVTSAIAHLWGTMEIVA